MGMEPHVAGRDEYCTLRSVPESVQASGLRDSGGALMTTRTRDATEAAMLAVIFYGFLAILLALG